MECEADLEISSFCIEELHLLEYSWNQLSGPSVVLNGAEESEASFVPEEAGEYTFCCQTTFPITEMNDKEEVSACDDITVTVVYLCKSGGCMSDADCYVSEPGCCNPETCGCEYPVPDGGCR